MFVSHGGSFNHKIRLNLHDNNDINDGFKVIFYLINYRYRAVKLRAEFDKQKGLTDVKKAKELLDAGELELEKKLHPNQL